MANIFLSYANEDRETARAVAGLLESAGWTVWWDRRIPAGRTWRSVIEEALREMRCMVVLWSANSVESDWVKEEAEEGRALGKLIPVLIESVKPPVGFRSIQAADLTDWNGSSDSLGARQLLADLESLMGKPAREPDNEAGRGFMSSEAAASSRMERDDDGASAEARRGKEGFARKPGAMWKTLAGGGIGIAVVSGLLLFWHSREQNGVSQRPNAQEQDAAAVSTPRLIGLGVNADRQEIKPTETLNLTLVGRYSDGSQSEIKREVEWSSSSPRVATINAQGQVIAYEAGRTEITAQHGGLASGAWTLAVSTAEAVKVPVAAKLVGLTVRAAKPELDAKEKISLHVTGKYSDGSEKGVSGGVLWQSSDTTIASVSAQGELEALRAGGVEVTARSGGLKSAPLYLVVKETPRKIPSEPSIYKAPQASPVALPALTEQSKLKTAPYLHRARDYRVQGNYAAALAELEKAYAVDPVSTDVRTEIEQTLKACNAEKILGRKGLEC
jgi:hypothetical protein